MEARKGEEARNKNGETNLIAYDSTTFKIRNTVEDAIREKKPKKKPMQNLNIKGRPVNIVESLKIFGNEDPQQVENKL